jgi:triosephosphate isomerase
MLFYLDVVVAPIYLHLVTVLHIKQNPHIEVAAQNCSRHGFGAFTGEVAAEQIKDLNINWVILGHSERRTHFGENDEVVSKKVESAFNNKLKVIFCFGETLIEREANRTIEVVERQLNAVVHLVKDWKNIVLAYEPVWAIGTGKTATTEQVEEIHDWIRGYLGKISAETEVTRIIYGGSVTEKNCDELIKVGNVDGFLVGGASLKPAFIDIVRAKK